MRSDVTTEATDVRTERLANQALQPDTLVSQQGSAQADRVEITQVIQQSGVSSLSGTANQIAASASTGSVTLSHVPETGWTTGSGTPNKGVYATYAGQVVGVGYVQAEVQAIDNAVKADSQRIKALEDAMRSRGLIN